MAKKFTVVLVFAFLLAVSFVAPSLTHAQKWWAPSAQEFNDKVNNTGISESEIFGERYTQAQVYWIIYSIQNFVFGTEVMECAADAGGSPVAFATCGALQTNSGDKGVFALAGIANTMLQTRPSGVGYVASVAQRIGIPVANAQQGGFGFTTALSPLLGVWAAARNAAYSLMALAVVVLAFMVMFRAKISPQVSVSVMSAIPRVIIGFLLITFSYAIAGFIVDMSYVVQGIIAALLYPSGLISQSGWSVVQSFNSMNNVGGGIVGYGLLIIVWAFVIGATTGLATSLITGGGALIVFGVIVVIVAIIFLIALIRVFWIMLKTYVLILFHVIALPFAALGYVAYPNGNTFIQLLRSLIGHVSIFVTISVVVMFASLIFWSMTPSNSVYAPLSTGGTASLFNPYNALADNKFPASGAGMPGFGATDMSGLAIFIGLVVLLMAPSVANNVKSLIATGRPDRGGLGLVGAGLVGGIGGALVGGAQKAGGEFVAKTAGVWGGNALARGSSLISRFRPQPNDPTLEQRMRDLPDRPTGQVRQVARSTTKDLKN